MTIRRIVYDIFVEYNAMVTLINYEILKIFYYSIYEFYNLKGK
jgi:hypothetical protein